MCYVSYSTYIFLFRVLNNYKIMYCIVTRDYNEPESLGNYWSILFN